jgi:hypothetical protein
MKRAMLWRYEGFEEELERIIASSSANISSIIGHLCNNDKPVDIVLGIRLAEMKKFALAPARLTTLLGHDDAYVRRAAAAYISAHRKEYPPELVSLLQKNTNRMVRATGLATENKKTTQGVTK